jgi:DNA-binding GntR family transcriptional regulator
MDPSPLLIKSSQQDLLLVKDNLAAYFREEIISGRFAPGEKIVEVRWAKHLKISQTSVREALNILLAEGFVQKGSGRTAQVTRLSDKDITHSYELRAVLEGYAARLVAQNKADLRDLDQSLADMRSAIECHNLRAFYERDLQFHLLLAEKTGNAILMQSLKRIVTPLFAFVVIRVQGARSHDEQWVKSLEDHKRIIEALRTHDPDFAERMVTQTVGRFLEETKDVVQIGR